MRNETRIDGEPIIGWFDAPQEFEGVVGRGEITTLLSVLGGRASLSEKKCAAAFLAIQVDKAKNRHRVSVRKALCGVKVVRMHIYDGKIRV